MKKKILILLLAGILFVVGNQLMGQSGESFHVIVNSDNATTTLSRSAVAKMFLKKVSTWDDGTKVLPVDQKESSISRIEFTEAIHGKPVSAITSYWQKMIFSGRSVPPPEKNSDQEVIAYVAAHPGAVGYISGAALPGPEDPPPSGYRVVRIVD